MAVQFILGRSGSGKTALCMRSITDALLGGDDDCGGPGLALLVPEQATWQAERMILADPRISGFSRLRVLSFNRLMFHLLGGSAQGVRPEISRAGRQMVVHKILRENVDRLKTFGPTAHAPGLAAELTKTIIELHEYEQQPEDVAGLAEGVRRTRPEHPAADKFEDLALVYRSYLDFLDSRADVFANGDARLTVVRQHVGRADWLKGGRLWVDGFSSFTVQQRQLLIELMKVAGESAIALCVDPAGFDWQHPEADAIDPADLFNSTQRTYADLFEAVTKSKLQLREPVILGTPLRFASSPALGHVEKHLFACAASQKASAADAVRIVAAPSARTEMNWIAGEIQRLVRRENCRFRDIAVVVSDIASCQHYIEAAFREQSIPFFIDRPRPLTDHPVIELITSALQAALGGFAAADVTAFLKTRLTGVAAEEIDRLENYCLAHGINGEDWLAEDMWRFAPPQEVRFDAGDIDRIRRRAVAPLIQLKDALSPNGSEQGITAATFTRAVWECLERLQLPEQIARWCEDDPDDSQGHRQFYEKLVSLFDELNAVFADTLMPGKDFAAILTQAVAGLALKLIPSRLDQVLVGAIERSRHPNLGIVFIAGATQKAFPTPVVFDAILTDDDRHIAEDHDFELADRLSRQLACRQYLAYIAFTRPSRRLYVSYPTMDAEGKPLVRSGFVDHLMSLFCDLRPESCLDGGSQIDGVYSTQQLKRLLCEALGRDGHEGGRRDVLLQVYQRMCSHGDTLLADAAGSVRFALQYDNRATLDAAACEKLIGRTLAGSVTRLGTFAACPYKHFVRYMLHIDTRTLFRFEPVDLGMFYHRVLERLHRALDAAGEDLASVEADALLALCRAQIAAIVQGDAFLANFRSRGAHNAYILDSAARTVEACVAGLAEMSRAGRFRQKASELRFGTGDGDLPPCRFDVADGRTVMLRGSIDRVDIAESDGRQIALVFDYKRREQAVSWARLFHGLDMQLAVYMLALQGACVAGRTIDAVAGAFFVPIEAAPGAEAISGIDAQMAKFAYKVKGIVDGQFAALLDDAPERNWNRYYNFAYDKDGEPYSYFAKTGALRTQQFDAVLAAAKGKILDVAQSIFAGEIAIRPYRMAKASPCGHCDYAPLCRFDWQINTYNALEPLDKNAFLVKIGGTQ
ncbi:MAG: exodeoxyribonuclease V subunit gamma [Phycisphaerae bacterium]|nr:exodeoxyribonuclease V subunit gamma [Phycisphaerae bacterium]